MTYVIERDLPIPARTKGLRGVGKWAKLADKMEIGDSVELNSLTEAKCLYMAFKNNGKGSCHRTVEGKIRVWRIK